MRSGSCLSLSLYLSSSLFLSLSPVSVVCLTHQHALNLGGAAFQITPAQKDLVELVVWSNWWTGIHPVVALSMIPHIPPHAKSTIFISCHIRLMKQSRCHTTTVHAVKDTVSLVSALTTSTPIRGEPWLWLCLRRRAYHSMPIGAPNILVAVTLSLLRFPLRVHLDST